MHSGFHLKAALCLQEFGGVRLEDNVVVIANGARSMTNVPRQVEDVEAVMAGAPWPPAAKSA